MATKSRSRRSSAGQAHKKLAGKRVVSADGQLRPEPNLEQALQLAVQLMALPGPSGREGLVAAFIIDQLRKAGAPETAIQLDTAHQRTPFQGEVGNLILKLPGAIRGPRRLLMAHLDTVPICVGSKPVLDGDFVRSGDPRTGLGADDRAGAAVVLSTALAILKGELPHPPLTFFWPIQEEVGLYGARHADLKLLGGPQLAFNWDGGTVEKITVGATGGYRMQIEVEGRASHAGVAPELGVSAIAIASLAISRLHQQGWHGRIVKGRRRGTSNVGFIEGGGATNVVTDRVQLRAEARSHDPGFRKQIVRAIERSFRRAASEVRSTNGARGKVAFDGRLDYESFRLARAEPCVLAAEAAIRAEGLTPVRAISNGGLDANWMTERGIPTVTLGCGQVSAHTTSEKLDIMAFFHACRIALRLALGEETMDDR